MINLQDIDNLVLTFINNYYKSISHLHNKHFLYSDQLSINAFIEEIKDDLKTGCITFVNKNEELEGLDSYLFYIVNSCCKKLSNIPHKKQIEYICPGCLYFNKISLLYLDNNLLSCDECKENLKEEKDPKKINFYNHFISHSKSGVKCGDCKRFVPKPLNNLDIICPYLDCCFSGKYTDLSGMHHPNSRVNIEKLSLDKNSFFKDSIKSEDSSQLIKLEVKEELESKIYLIKEVIDNQSNSISYTENKSTTIHKLLVYKAFSNILNKYKEDFVNYLLNNSRSGGFQHKIFQEYVRLLENSFPYFYRKGGKNYKITSLLDPKLNIFDGISEFEGIVNDNLIIKNGTKEIYIGGRKSKYILPYYIGKILSIVDKNNNSLMGNIEEYSFLKIKVKDIKPGNKVFVSHLRVAPHYQMGGMVYVNRIKKKITDRIFKNAM
jgi:hypothetical protein